MKKLIILSGVLIFMLTGCGIGATETLKCTYTTDSNNITSKLTYNIDHIDNEVKKIRVMYDYHMNDNADNMDDDKVTDGVGTGTDGTTNDTQNDNDGIIDGIVGSAIDSVINGVTDVILDIAGIKDRHMTVQSTYGDIPGFSIQNTSDTTNNDYKVTYVIDYDTISDDDLRTLNLSRDFNILKDNYTSQGFTCAE